MVSFEQIKSKTNRSRLLLIAFIAVFGLIGVIILAKSLAQNPVVANVEVEQLSLPTGASIVSDSSASGGTAVKYASVGSSTGNISINNAATSVTFLARAVQCSAKRITWPTFNITVDGQRILSSTVSSTSYKTFSVATSLVSGSHKVVINVSAGNGTAVRSRNSTSCGASLDADKLVFYGATPVATPPPTITINASPTSVTTGLPSTVTWSTVNATSCSASGAWSGAEPLTGSISTGALNQTNTYILTCLGQGGSTTANTTVTVNPPVVPPAPTVYLNPGSQSYTLGSTFTVDVRENSGATGVNVVQANITYPQDMLTFVSMDNSQSAFPVDAPSGGANGTISLARGIVGSVTGDQLVTTITFKVNSVVGIANLPFINDTMLLNATTNQNLLSSLNATGGANFYLH